MPNVLVVEDDHDTRDNLCDLLELDGFFVDVAGTAKEALASLAAKAFDIVILDRRLPDGLAEELLPGLVTSAPETDFVVVTGYADMDSTIAAMRSGAADYILKPINPEAFRARLQGLLERRRIKRELHDEQQFAEKILSTAEAIVLVLNCEGKILRFNPYLEKLTGRTLSEVQGLDWVETFIPLRERARVQDVLKATVAGKETSGTVNKIETRRGEFREIRWSNTTLKDEQGQDAAVLSIGLDVTDYIASQNRALQAERLATIGQMMAALAHESRNALQRIQASSDLLGLEVEGNAQAESDLAKLRRAASDLNRLLEEVRSFAAPIHLKLESVRLSHILDQAWGHLELHKQQRDSQLKVALDPDLDLELDVLRFEQVFRNLFENALAACNDPVTISVTSHLENGSLELAVQDNGPGIEAPHVQKVFDAFHTTKDSGTGLGLAIVQRIVQAHRGTIHVDEACDSGARFVIRLPHSSHNSRQCSGKSDGQ